MLRQMRLSAGAAVAAVAAALLTAAPAQAAPADKPEVLSRWTQTSASSYQSWYAARQNQAAWAAYGFDWSTDYCTTSPDNPYGYPFALSCARHDFGYRNYKAMRPVRREQGPSGQCLLRGSEAGVRRLQR